MTPDQIPALTDAKRTGEGRYVACCPAHEDRHASLSIRFGDRGVLLKCWAGCAPDAVLAALGLNWSDLFYEAASSAAAPCRRGHIRVTRRKHLRVVPSIRTPNVDGPDLLPSNAQVEDWCARIGQVGPWLHTIKGWDIDVLRSLGIGWDGRRVTIPVRDSDGDLLTVMRYRPDGHPKMLPHGEGHGRHLYPAPETFLGPVWLVEGEPDAISAAMLGLPAVAVPGSGGWRPEWASRFEGRPVVVCMDADDAGDDLAARVLSDVARVSEQVRHVDLSPVAAGVDVGDLVASAVHDGDVAGLRAWLQEMACD